jgi:proline iminopeptidase
VAVKWTLALLGFALLGWGLCGATIGVARGLMPMEGALAVHAVAAPIIAGTLAYLYARCCAVTTPLVTGLAFVGVPVVMDAVLIAPFVERSWDMFRSPIGTWIPFGLMFLAAWGAALWVMGPGPGWRWHATRPEKRRALSGDGLIPEAKRSSTQGITIAAPPSAVWPWLVQMGCDRAGWYSWDRLDNAGRPSADRILPELQGTTVGDVLPAEPGRREAFVVLELEAPQHMILGAYLCLPGNTRLGWNDPPPRRFIRASWAFVLEPLEGGTRLLVRGRGINRPWWLSLLLAAFFGPAHIIMQRKQLLNLKARSERSEPAGPRA